MFGRWSAELLPTGAILVEGEMRLIRMNLSGAELPGHSFIHNSFLSTFSKQVSLNGKTTISVSLFKLTSQVTREHNWTKDNKTDSVMLYGAQPTIRKQFKFSSHLRETLGYHFYIRLHANTTLKKNLHGKVSLFLSSSFFCSNFLHVNKYRRRCFAVSKK